MHVLGRLVTVRANIYTPMTEGHVEKRKSIWIKLPMVSKKLTCNGDNTVLLSSTNNTVICGKVILRVVALLVGDNKKCCPRYMRVSLHGQRHEKVICILSCIN